MMLHNLLQTGQQANPMQQNWRKSCLPAADIPASDMCASELVCSSGCWDEGSPDKSKEMFSLKYEGRRTEHFLLWLKMLHLHGLMGVTSKSTWNVCNVWDLPVLVEPSSRDCWTDGATGMFG